jgi:two-component system sensor histidine kinase KdpD
MAENAARSSQELALQEQKLREEQSVFFSLVAHELRTPLGVVVAGLKNLGRQLVNAGQDTHARLTRISRATDRMAVLIERHLQLQRLASANFTPLRSSVSPLELASDVLLHLRDLYPQRLFELSSANDLPDKVDVDADLVILALTNLLSNAAKYSPADKAIRLEVTGDTMLRYRVIDCGPGIAPSERERIFDIFHRVSSSDGQTGFGIGLATARRVAAIHKGTLDYAERAGGGAVFTLSLPLLLPTKTAAT